MSARALAVAPMVALLVGGCAGARSGHDGDDVPPELKLPRTVRPLRYALELTLIPERDRFEGKVDIEVDVARPLRVVWMHARDLVVRAASVEVAGAHVAAAFEQVTPEGVARLTPARPLPAGRATLHLAFDGAWNERLVGLYRTRQGGAAYAFTHFEPIDARRAFPGFDEPSFKAPFDVTLVVPAGQVAVSNAPVAAEEAAPDGLRRIRFAPTPPLPTYLVFAAAGPFEVVEARPLPPDGIRARPLPLRTIAPRGTAHRFAFALDVTRELVPVLEQWFAIPFPYAKLDQVIAPDFAAGGMENAGAILYSDERLSFEPGRSPEQKRAAVAGLVAHELAHQWFGDLVTLAWWEDVWLNESFATFMTWKALAAWRPELEEDAEVAVRVDEVMGQDALATARAVRQPLTRMAEVLNQFDRLSYVKGASVLRTYERFLGAERFRDAIRGYLAANAHGTGTTEGVVTALSAAAARDLGPALRTLLDQPGVPLVEARVACDAQGTRLELAVERWRPLGSRAPPARYQLPVCARWEVGGVLGEGCALLDGGHGALPLPGCPRWVMPDAGGTSYYRWSLALADLGRLREGGFAHLTAAERLAYGQMLLAAARAGRTPYADALTELAPLARDGARRVATAPMPALAEAVDALVPEAARPRARQGAAALYRPALRELGLDPADGEPRERRLLREDVARFLVEVARDPDVTRELAGRGRAYAGVEDARFHPDAVSADLVEVALSATIVEGDARTFDALLARLPDLDDGEQRGRVLAALASARAPALSARALTLVGDPRLRVQERPRPLFAQAAYPETREAAWRALRDRFDALAVTLSPGAAASLPGVGAHFCDRDRAAEVRSELAARAEKLPGARRILAQAVERVELCAALREAQGASAAGWLERR
jgi:alanyl aminopeptidase